MSTAATSQSTSFTRGRFDGTRARPASFATQMAAAPSVSGDELPAVSVPCPLARSNAGLSVASFSAEVSARGIPSFTIPSTGITRSSKNPEAIAFTARWCEASAMRSWSERAMCHCLAISSQCSPMLLPVARFATAGMCRPKSFQRKSVTLSMRSPKLRAVPSLRIQSDMPCVSPICTRLMLSTPPHNARSISLPSIPAASNTATMLVEHASTVLKAGVAWSMPASITSSRAMLLQPRFGATVPHTTRSGREPAGSCAAIAFATGTESASASSLRSGPSTRAKGERTPDTSQVVMSISSFPSPAAVPALEALAVARELLLQLLAALLRVGHAPPLVRIELERRVDARDVMAPESVREFLGAKTVDAQPLQRRAADPERRLESLALDDLHPAQLQLEIVAHVARPGDDFQRREVHAHPVDEREALLDVVDGVHEQPRLLRAGGLEEVEPRRIAVEHGEAELAQRLDLVGIVIHDDRVHVARQQQAPDDLAEAPEARDDHGALLGDRIGLALGFGLRADEPVVGEEEERRGRHRERHGDREEPFPLGGEKRGFARGSEHDEREFPALRQEEREKPALPADLDRLRNAPKRKDLEREEPDEQQRDGRGMRAQQAEVDRHPHRDEEKAEQQSLEGLDVAHQRVAELAAREQHAGEEGPQRHRHAHQGHELCDAEHEQERERREDFAKLRLRDEPQHGPQEVASHDDDRRDRRGGKSHPHPERIRARNLDVPQERDERDQRDRRDVLEEKDAEGRAARGRVELVPLGELLHRDRRGRERERQAADERALPGEPREVERKAQHEAARRKLQRSAAEDYATHREEALGIELEPDHEEHEHHAQLRKVARRVRLAHQAQSPGADEGARDEVAQHGSQADALGDRHADHGGGEEDQRFTHCLSPRRRPGAIFSTCPSTRLRNFPACSASASSVSSCESCATKGSSHFMWQ